MIRMSEVIDQVSDKQRHGHTGNNRERQDDRYIDIGLDQGRVLEYPDIVLNSNPEGVQAIVAGERIIETHQDGSVVKHQNQRKGWENQQIQRAGGPYLLEGRFTWVGYEGTGFSFHWPGLDYGNVL